MSTFDKVIYLDNSIGSDDNDGTREKPFSTMTKVTSVIKTLTETNILVYIKKGIYPITSLVSLSCSKKKITYIGKNKNTTLLVNSDNGSFNGALDICNLIIKPSDNFTGDTRVIAYTTDSFEVNYRNCLFLLSDNTKYPSVATFYTTSSGYGYTGKNCYNCSFKDLYACGSGSIKVYNCCTNKNGLGYNNLSGYLNVEKDCISNVEYKKDYKIASTDYGVYSGNTSWNNVKALLNDNGNLKTYDVETNSLIDFTGNISELFNEDSELIFIEDLDDVKSFLKNEGVKVILNKPVKCNVKAIKTVKQLFIANGDFYTGLAENIDYLKFDYNISDEDCSIKVVVSIDSGESWYYYNEAWTKLDVTTPLKDFSNLSESEKTQRDLFLDTVLEKGIDVKDISTFNFNLLEAEKIRFAYAIKIKDINSEVIIKKLDLQFDSIGDFTQLNPKTEVTIKINNSAISVTPLKNIELMKINVGISSQIPQSFDTSGLLDKETFKGDDYNSVKIADKAKTIEVPKSQLNGRMYYGTDNNDIEVKPRVFPAGTCSEHIDTYDFNNLIKDVPQTIPFVKERPNVNVVPVAMKYVEGEKNQEEVLEKYNDNNTIKKSSVEVCEEGLKIKDEYILESTLNSDGYYESEIFNKSDYDQIIKIGGDYSV